MFVCVDAHEIFMRMRPLLCVDWWFSTRFSGANFDAHVSVVRINKVTGRKRRRVKSFLMAAINLQRSFTIKRAERANFQHPRGILAAQIIWLHTHTHPPGARWILIAKLARMVIDYAKLRRREAISAPLQIFDHFKFPL